MRKYFNFISITFVVLPLFGCSHIEEGAKKFWGSSVAHLEEARATGSSKTFSCSYSECFDAVVALGQDRSVGGQSLKNDFYQNTNAADVGIGLGDDDEKDEAEGEDEDADDEEKKEKEALKSAKYAVFQKSLRKGYVVVMFVPGAVDTTEVGIFFTPLDEGRVRVDVSSLSTHAKITVSRAVFGELETKFGEVRNDRT